MNPARIRCCAERIGRPAAGRNQQVKRKLRKCEAALLVKSHVGQLVSTDVECGFIDFELFH